MIAHYTKTAHFLDYIHPSGHFRISSFQNQMPLMNINKEFLA
jgi:hypothetical protein